MKKVIAVDFDDVVMNFHNGFMNSHNQRYGTTLTFDQLVDYDNWERLYGHDKETMKERAMKFYHSPEHSLVEPVDGAPEAIAALSQTHSLQIVTSRPDSVKELTVAWLAKHFPNMFSDFHFTNIYAGAADAKPKIKSEICREIGAAVLIDDALRHVKDVAQSGIPALLPDRPWNRAETPEGVHRVHTWDDIVTWIRQNV